MAQLTIEELLARIERLDSQLNTSGLRPNSRPYRPHVTHDRAGISQLRIPGRLMNPERLPGKSWPPETTILTIDR